LTYKNLQEFGLVLTNVNAVEILKLPGTLLTQCLLSKERFRRRAYWRSLSYLREYSPAIFFENRSKVSFPWRERNVPVMQARSSLFKLRANSTLYRAICNPQSDGTCNLKSIVRLSSNLAYSNEECELDTIRTLEIPVSSSRSVYYEFVQIPCVELEFPENPVSTFDNNRNFPVCVDQQAKRAAPMCCPRTANTAAATLNTKYDGKLTSYDAARSRCAKEIKMFARILGLLSLQVLQLPEFGLLLLAMLMCKFMKTVK
jgi:hypothetical protein